MPIPGRVSLGVQAIRALSNIWCGGRRKICLLCQRAVRKRLEAAEASGRNLILVRDALGRAGALELERIGVVDTMPVPDDRALLVSRNPWRRAFFLKGA